MPWLLLANYETYPVTNDFNQTIGKFWFIPRVSWDNLLPLITLTLFYLSTLSFIRQNTKHNIWEWPTLTYRKHHADTDFNINEFTSKNATTAHVTEIFILYVFFKEKTKGSSKKTEQCHRYNLPIEFIVYLYETKTLEKTTAQTKLPIIAHNDAPYRPAPQGDLCSNFSTNVRCYIQAELVGTCTQIPWLSVGVVYF